MKNNNQKHLKKKQKTIGIGVNFISTGITLLYPNIQILMRNHKAYKETGRYGPKDKKISLQNYSLKRSDDRSTFFFFFFLGFHLFI